MSLRQQLNKRTFLWSSGILLFLLLGLVLREYRDLCKPGVVVLLYHRVELAPKDDNKYTISVSEFKKQLLYLAQHGYKTIVPREILQDRPAENFSNTVILSFDDGTSDHYSIVFPLLKDYGFKGLFFVISKKINSPGYLTSHELSVMAESGMEIGSHSYSHRLLDELPYEDVYADLKKSKDQLENICKRPILSFAPPGGWYNADVIRAARNLGFRFFFGCEIGRNNLQKHPFVYKRIEVLRDMDIRDFERLLNPPDILIYKSIQSLKFLVHDILGSRIYWKLSRIAN